MRSALPDAAQTRFRQVANGRMDAGDPETSAIRQAWHAVKQGWEKSEDGDWVRKVSEQSFIKAEVAKVDAELGLVFGWGIICKVDGEPYFDLQHDHIPEDAMLRVTADFMEKSRISGDMHARDAQGEPIPDGGVVFSFPLTTEVAKAMGIETHKTGWLIAVRPSPEVLEKYRDGTYTGFSIGGQRVEDEDADEDFGKHGEHDQSTHGGGGGSGKITDKDYAGGVDGSRLTRDQKAALERMHQRGKKDAARGAPENTEPLAPKRSAAYQAWLAGVLNKPLWWSE